ncbi:MAG TPA: hypothetical protein PLB11_16350 [Flavobacterium sp.]|nr:hypothetical protein [Flavobacterium sp.]
MSIEVLSGIGIILIVAIWAAFYIYKRNRENNNEHLFDFIPHLFPTLGILFTFLGIAIGLWNFDSNDIEKSIPELMNGLKTAFLVSIFGVAQRSCVSSLICSISRSHHRNFSKAARVGSSKR